MSAATKKRTTSGSWKTPMSESYKQTLADYEWLCRTPSVCRKHAGEWIAIYKEEVIAHGKDAMEVALRAKAITPDYLSGYIEDDDDEDMIL